MRIRVLMAAACGAGLFLAACGGSNKVGDNSLLNFKDQANKRLGDTTTTGAPATTVAGAKGQLGIGGTTATTKAAAVPTTTHPAPQVATLEIDINSDGTSSTQFDPSNARIFRGSIIKWTNKDTQARSVESDTGAFRSPSIPPGGSWSWTPNAAGQFNYHDGTRPYAVGSFEVLNK